MSGFCIACSNNVDCHTVDYRINGTFYIKVSTTVNKNPIKDKILTISRKKTSCLYVSYVFYSTKNISRIVEAFADFYVKIFLFAHWSFLSLQNSFPPSPIFNFKITEFSCKWTCSIHLWSDLNFADIRWISDQNRNSN